MTTDHTCNGCPACIPELSADYWRQRAHQAEEHAEAYLEQTRLLNVRIRELGQQVEQLQTQLARFWT